MAVTDGEGALAGLRVVDCSRLIAGGVRTCPSA
jgi:hypothetical protein